MTTFVKSTITAAVAALLLTCGNFGADARRAHRHIHPVPCRTVIISAVPPVTVRVHNHFNREERLQEKHIVTTIKTDPGRGFRMLMGRYEEPVYWHIRRKAARSKPGSTESPRTRRCGYWNAAVRNWYRWTPQAPEPVPCRRTNMWTTATWKPSSSRRRYTLSPPASS